MGTCRRLRSICSAAILLLTSLSAVSAAEPPVCTRLLPRAPQPVAWGELRVLDSMMLSFVEGGPKHSLLLTSDSPATTPNTLWDRYDLLRVLPRTDGNPDLDLVFSIEEVAGESQPTIVTGDADGDGVTDLFVLHRQNNSSAQTLMEFWRGNGDGRFVRSVPLVGLSPDSRLVAADVDADGRDEVVAITCTRATAYRFDGSGWIPGASPSVPNLTQILAADLDGDGDDDLLGIQLQAVRGFHVLFGDPVAPLASMNSYSVPFTVYSLASTIEVDGDAAAEILLSSKNEPQHAVTFHALQLGSGGATADAVWDLPLPRGVAWWWPYDVDTDGIDEIVLEFDTVSLNGWSSYQRFCSMVHSRAQGLQFVTMTGSQPALTPRSSGSARLVEIHDVDRDGQAEALMIPASGFGLVSTPIGPDLVLDQPQEYQHDRSGIAVPELLAADLNHDRFGDLLIGHQWDFSHAGLLGRGDGDYTVEPITRAAHSYVSSYVHDVDGDGNVDVLGCIDDTADLKRIVDISYGSSNGSRTSFLSKTTGLQFQYFAFGDLDGDGDDDMIANAPWDSERWMWQSPIIVQGRRWDIRPGVIKHHRQAWLIDIDRDGLADPVYVEPNYSWVDGPRTLLWQRTLPGVRFGEPQQLAQWTRSSGELSTILEGELDGTGNPELLLVIDNQTHRTLWTLRRDAGPRLRTLVRDTIPTVDTTSYPHRDLTLVDIDHDGSLDLASTRADIRFWRGDGSGRFLAPAIVWNADSAPVLSDVDGDGWLDGVGRSDLGLDRGLAWSRTRPQAADDDVAAPSIEYRLDPLPYDLDPSPAFDNEWRLIVRLEDDCDAAPRLVSDRLLVRAGAAALPVVYRAAATEEIRLYSSDRGVSPAIVVLRGPRETEVRDHWAAIQAAAGIDLERHHELRLLVSQQLGATPATWDDELTVDNLRLTHRYAFQSGRLILASVSYPGADLEFRASARDAAGRSADTSTTFLAQRDRYCAGAGAASLICP